MAKSKAARHAKANPHVMIEPPPRQPTKVTDKLHWGRIFWVVGTTPKNMTPNDINDPPTNGQQCAFAFPGEKFWMVFCPISFSSYRIRVGHVEQKSFIGDSQARTKKELSAWLTERWLKFANAGFQVDYNMAARVLKELGAEVPTIVPTAKEGEEEKERGGKPVEDKLLKPIKRTSKRGKVLDWFLAKDEARSIREAMAEFEASRSSVLSFLHNLNKDHGIGYRLIGDTAVVTLPADCGKDGPWL